MTKIRSSYDVALELLNLLSSSNLVFLLTLLADGFIEQGNSWTSLWWVKFFPSGHFALEYHFYICFCVAFVWIVCDYVLFKCVTLYFSAKKYYISFRLLEVYVLRLWFKVSSRVGFIIFVSCTRFVFTLCRNNIL